MTTSTARRATALATGAFLLTGPLSAVGGLVLAAPASAATCVAAPISELPTITTSNASKPGTDIVAYQRIRYDFAFANIAPNHCAGDTVTLVGPKFSLGQAGQVYDLVDANKVKVATMKVGPDGRTLTVTLLVDNVTNLSGWLTENVQSSVRPNTVENFDFTANGVPVPVPVQIGDPTCDTACQTAPQTSTSKAGKLTAAAGVLDVTVLTPSASKDAQVMTVTDTLTTTGQSFDCSVTTVPVDFVQGRNYWGALTVKSRGTAKVVGCTPTKMTVEVTVPKAGQSANVYFQPKVDPSSAGPWKDTASTTADGATPSFSALTVSAQAGGGVGAVPSQPIVTNPKVAITTTVDKAVAVEGETLTYTTVVTNPGDVPLQPTLTFSPTSPVTGVTGDTNKDGLIDPTETWTYTHTGTAGAPGTQTLVSTVVGNDFDDAKANPTASSQASTTVNPQVQPPAPVPNPGVAIDIEPVAPEVTAGEDAVFTVTVTNTGEAVLTGTPLTGLTGGTLVKVSGPDQLAPGEKATYTYTVPTTGAGTVAETVTTTGVDGVDSTVDPTATDTAQVVVKAAPVTPAPQPEPTPTPQPPVTGPAVAVDRATFQVDTMTWKNRTWATRYFGMANDGLLMPGEGKRNGIWKQLSRGRYIKEQARFVTVEVQHDPSQPVTKEQWADAVSRATGIDARVMDRRKSTKASRGTITYVWMLDKDASAAKPHGQGYNLAQWFISRSA